MFGCFWDEKVGKLVIIKVIKLKNAILKWHPAKLRPQTAATVLTLMSVRLYQFESHPKSAVEQVGGPNPPRRLCEGVPSFQVGG